jgi:hypothetical protein
MYVGLMLDYPFYGNKSDATAADFAESGADIIIVGRDSTTGRALAQRNDIREITFGYNNLNKLPRHRMFQKMPRQQDLRSNSRSGDAPRLGSGSPE